MEKLVFVILVVCIYALLWIVWQKHNDGRSIADSKENFREQGESDAIRGTPKEYGIYLLMKGIWRRNRIKNKI